MQCHKPTSCGNPDVSQYIEYIGFGLVYLAFLIGVLRYARGALKKSTNIFASATGKSLLLNIILLCVLKIVICADIWINMSEQLFLFIGRVSYVPFGLAVLLLTLSWTKLWFYLSNQSNYQRKLRVCQLISIGLFVLTALCGLIFGYVLFQIFYAFLVCALMYLYLSVLYFISAFQVFYILKKQYPVLEQTFGTSLKINASVVSFCILSRVIMNMYLAYTHSILDGVKVRQINDAVMNIVCEIIPLFFALIRMHFQVTENQNFKNSIAIDQSEQQKSNDFYRNNSTFVFLRFKDEEDYCDGYLESTVSTKPATTQGPQ